MLFWPIENLVSIQGTHANQSIILMALAWRVQVIHYRMSNENIVKKAIVYHIII